MKKLFFQFRVYHSILGPIALLIFSIISLISLSNLSYAQIFEPEGLNLPGSWNGWINPPTNNLALASSTQVTDGRVVKITTGTTRWQTIFKVDETESDLTGGTYEWKFTSGSGNPWYNQWTLGAYETSVSVTLNVIENYNFHSDSNPASNLITLQNGMWYTMNWEDIGYQNTRAIFMETSEEPIDIVHVSSPAEDVDINIPVEITITTSANPSFEEIIYLRYSNDGWSTSTALTVEIDASTGTVQIPGQPSGTTVSFYVFSSTVENITQDHDLCTIKFNNNSGSNYSYTVGEPIIGWANLQHPESGSIQPEGEFMVYARVLVDGLTGSGAPEGGAEGIAAWIGYSLTDALEIEDFNSEDWIWISASYNPYEVGFGNNSQYSADIGSGITDEDTYFYVSRFRLNDGEFAYGGFSGGFWDGENNVSGVLEVATEVLPAIGWANLQHPESGSIQPESEFMVYARVLVDGLTGSGAPEGGAEGIAAWIGYSLTDALEIEDFNSEDWIWISASYNPYEVGFGNNSQYSADIGSGIETEGTYFYVSRFRLNDGEFAYGGFSGRFWDGENNVSGVLEVATEVLPAIGWANLQHPESGSIQPESEFMVYARVLVDGLTGSGAPEGGAEGIAAWIGYSLTDALEIADFNSEDWIWISASYNAYEVGFGNNSQYSADIGSGITDEGTYFYASRFQLNDGEFAYGGFSGGFWDGENNVSGVLEVATEILPTIGWANLQHPESGSIQPEGEFMVYARVLVDGLTGSGAPEGGAEGIAAWIGYSLTDAIEIADFNSEDWIWISASYNPYEVGFGNNSQYSADIGSGIETEGTYFYVSRFRLNDGEFAYGGFSGRFWDGENNVSGVLEVATEVLPAIGWANLQHPESGSIQPEGEFMVYARVLVDGHTGSGAPEGGAEGIAAWIGYSLTDAIEIADFNSEDWIWISASYNPYEVGFGNNSQYSADIGSGIETEGTYFYVSRFRLNDGEFAYGGFSGRFWDGENNVSGVLEVATEVLPAIGWANLQHPESGSIQPESEFMVYARVLVDGLTGSGAPEGGAEGIAAWIGYSLTDALEIADFNSEDWIWISANYNPYEVGFGNNSQYSADIGSGIETEGTYFYASRFRLNDGEFAYGGFSGGFWDGENNVSGVLEVATEVLPAIGWANLQHPESGSIQPEGEFMVYARVLVDGHTGSGAPEGGAEGIAAWIGYSLTDAIEIADFNSEDWIWISASYNPYEVGFGNNSQYSADIGSGIETEGTYFYVSRFRLNDGEFAYGGFSGRFWDGENNVSGVLEVATEVLPAIGWANLQHPESGSIQPESEFMVYARVLVDGLTGSGAPEGGAEGIAAWIGYSLTDALEIADFNSEDWIWISANYNPYEVGFGNNSQYSADIGSGIETEGTYFYVSRFQLNDGEFAYGGFSGGFWDGEDNVSGILTVATVIPPSIGWANLQHPESGSIQPESEFMVYARVLVDGLTGSGAPEGGAEGLAAWIGYCLTDAVEIADFNSEDWIWISANYNPYEAGFGNNSQYSADIGSGIADEGTYFYASRFQLNDGEFAYGGFSGGFWDGENNVSGVLYIQNEIIPHPVTFQVLNSNPYVTEVYIRGSFNDWTDQLMNSENNFWQIELNLMPGTYQWGVADQNGDWLLQGPNLEFTLNPDGSIIGITSFTIQTPSPNYGLRDDDGVNLPQITYWYSGESEDITESGSMFDGKDFGEINDLYIKGVLIKTWKTQGGNVTSAKFSYKVWDANLEEPVSFIERIIGWSSNDNPEETDQTWAGFGDEINITQGLEMGSYNLKVLFSIDGTGIPGTTQSGPFVSTLAIPPSDKAEILSFEFSLQTGPAIINSNQATIDIEVSVNDNLASLVPTITVSPYATISPPSGVVQNFTNPFVYTVTAQDGLTNKLWTILVTQSTTLSNSAEIIEFTLSEQTGPAIINSENATISLEVAYGSDISTLSPSITISPLASIDPPSGMPQDFTEPVTYTVTAEDSSQKNWIVTVNEAPAPPFNYGLRDDDGLNLPTLTYWYNGAEEDITQKGEEFDGTNLGNITDLFIKGCSIKTWKAEGGDVTAANFLYKVWEVDSEEPEYYTIRSVLWTSNDNPEETNQTWAGFGDEIDITFNLNPNTYNIKILFSIEGTGNPGTTVNGPFTGSFEIIEQPSEITFANLHWPEEATIEIGGSIEVFAQITVSNAEVDEIYGIDGLQVWIGLSDTDTDPNTWTEWVLSNYNGISTYTSRPEYVATIGENIAEEGIYFYASRFKLNDDEFVYGGFNGGFWDGINNVSGLLTVTEDVPEPEITWANIQWPPNGNIQPLSEFLVYAQVYIENVTGANAPSEGVEGLTAWIGISTTNSTEINDFSSENWTWIPALYNAYDAGFGNNSQYSANIGSDIAEEGTYYYASRFKLNDDEFVYGGFNGGFWDGINNVSGVLTVTDDTPEPVISWANLQYPGSGTFFCNIDEEFLVYSRVFIEEHSGVNAPETGIENLSSWIGYSLNWTSPPTTIDDFLNGDWIWIPATYNPYEEAFGNNSQYSADIGTAINESGVGCYTFALYVSRYKLNDDNYVYGGFSESGGGFWDGIENVVGELELLHVDVPIGQDSKLKLYPNPTSGMLNVEAPLIFDITIFDSSGRIIYFRSNNEVSTKIDLSHIEPGIYIVKIKNSEQIINGKLIKQ
jgi:hypothetical protein